MKSKDMVACTEIYIS